MRNRLSTIAYFLAATTVAAAAGADKPPAKPPAPPAAKSPAKPPAPPAAKPPAKPDAKPTAPPAAPPAKTGAPPASSATAKPASGSDATDEKKKQEASAAFKAGKAALDDNKLTEALAKFRESHAIHASPNSRLMIGRTLAKLGKNAEAYREALAAGDEARAAAAENPKYAQTASDAHDDLVALEKKIALVTVRVAGDPGQATLSVGGAVIDKAAWAAPIALDPGAIEVVLTTGAGASRKTVAATAGAKLTVPIELPKAAVAVAGKSTEPTIEAKAEAKPGPGDGAWHGPNRKIIGFVSLGVGAAGMALFGVFGALSKSEASSLAARCPSAFNCDPSVYDTINRGKSYQIAANTSVTVGAIGLATGVGFILWDVLDRRPKENASAMLPRLLIGPGGVTLSGSF